MYFIYLAMSTLILFHDIMIYFAVSPACNVYAAQNDVQNSFNRENRKYSIQQLETITTKFKKELYEQLQK